jgi:hypothetical protein
MISPVRTLKKVLTDHSHALQQPATERSLSTLISQAPGTEMIVNLSGSIQPQERTTSSEDGYCKAPLQVHAIPAAFWVALK